ncbi:hypothetical protein [Fodinicola feengrottensis]|uniref:Heparin binding hemagglutinin HbhA n=1 Tax=Fodinicola feengrottensis TaxID=435914 RepID=A0ABN2I497_9ACTN|nr:hypothetical protein [Fodinicola feengrottensis]
MAIETKTETRSTTDLLTGPFYAVAGVGDLAVAELRKLPQLATDLQKRSQELAERTRNSVKPEEVRGQLAKQREQLTKQFEDAQTKATKTYEDLVSRGRKTVDSIRNQKATQELVNRVDATARSAKATATTVRKGAERARTSAKGTVTSARKTAAAAGKAVEDGAEKIG